MQRVLDVVFFDLGNTLLYPARPWPPILKEADAALVDEINRQGCLADPQRFLEDFEQDIHTYHRERDQDYIEFTAEFVLQKLLHRSGVNLPIGQARAALNALYAITQKNWLLEEDALNTLERLKSQGYRLGLISNASDAEDVRSLLAQHQLTGYFDPILISAEIGMRKPHPYIFQMALALSKTTAQQAAMVGDSLKADIAGAHGMGMTAIWITRRVENPALQGDTRPDACVASLAELPARLEGLGSPD